MAAMKISAGQNLGKMGRIHWVKPLDWSDHQPVPSGHEKNMGHHHVLGGKKMVSFIISISSFLKAMVKQYSISNHCWCGGWRTPTFLGGVWLRVWFHLLWQSRQSQPSGNVQMVLGDGHHEHIVPLQIRGHEVGLLLHEGLRTCVTRVTWCATKFKRQRKQWNKKGNHALIKKSQNKVSCCVTIASSLL